MMSRRTKQRRQQERRKARALQALFDSPAVCALNRALMSLSLRLFPKRSTEDVVNEWKLDE